MRNRIITQSGTLVTSPPLEDVVLNPRNPRYNKAVAEGRFLVNGVQYIRRKDKARKGDKAKEWSSIWSHGVALIRFDNKNDFFYYYEYENKSMDQTLPIVSGTTTPRKHIVKAHYLNLDTGEVIERAVDLDSSNELVIKKSNSKFRTLLVR